MNTSYPFAEFSFHVFWYSKNGLDTMQKTMT